MSASLMYRGLAAQQAPSEALLLSAAAHLAAVAAPLYAAGTSWSYGVRCRAGDALRGIIQDAVGALLSSSRVIVGVGALPSRPPLELDSPDESGYTAMWQADKSPQAQTRLENLKELVRFMHDFETLQGFLEHVSLVMDADQGSDGDRVSLMTLHAAKGLEFGIVFLPGWEEGLFPHQRSLDESGKAGLEEERRLAYVGLTRARRRAKISFAQNRRTHGLYQSALPSRFVDELPPATVDVIESEMPYGGRATYGYGNPFGPSRFDRASGSEPFGSNYKTPGWQRAQQSWSSGRDTKKRARTPITLEGELVAASTANAPNFRTGSRVRHEKFGDGTVTLVDGNKLTINFDDGSTKRVVASFVDLI